jgi:hypothetical protein
MTAPTLFESVAKLYKWDIGINYIIHHTWRGSLRGLSEGHNGVEGLEQGHAAGLALLPLDGLALGRSVVCLKIDKNWGSRIIFRHLRKFGQGRYTLSDKSADAKSAETFFSADAKSAESFFLQIPNPQRLFFSRYQICRFFFLHIPLTKSANQQSDLDFFKTVWVRRCLRRTFHFSNFYTLPSCSPGHAISKNLHGPSVALFLPAVVNFWR